MNSTKMIICFVVCSTIAFGIGYIPNPVGNMIQGAIIAIALIFFCKPYFEERIHKFKDLFDLKKRAKANATGKDRKLHGW